MSLFTSILCGVDFSEHSAGAIRAAVELARVEKAFLTIVHVIDPLLVQAGAIASDLHQVTSQAREDLEHFAADLLGDISDLRSHPEFAIAAGKPGREILRWAGTRRADLIVLGTHGLGGVEKFLFGSTTADVLHDTGTAVLAVPRTDKAGTGLGSGPIIVLGLALNRNSARLLADAAQFARDLHASLILAHIVPALQIAPRWRKQVRGHHPARLAQAQVELDSISNTASLGVPATSHVAAGDPATELTRLVAERNAALIIVGLGRSQSVLHRPGTTAYRTISGSSVAVLALPEQGE